MTYQHALRYLTDPQATRRGDTQALLRAFIDRYKTATLPLLVSFHANKLGHTAAQMLRSVLVQAGVPCLHWADHATLPSKQRFFVNDKPISPPLMASIAGELHELEHSAKDTSLSVAERCAAVLWRIATSENCRVVLLESPTDIPHLPLFFALAPRSETITVLSDKDDHLHEATHKGTRFVITPAYGPAFYHRISDACAAGNIRLETIKKSKREAVTLGSQTLHYGKFPPCRISSGSPLCATAAFLTLECVTALARLSLSLGDTAVQSGLLRADVSHACHVRSIHPILLSDLADSPKEFQAALDDLNELLPMLPSPRCLWRPAHYSDIPAPMFDEMYGEDTPLQLCENGTTVVIGPSDFVEKFILALQKKPKKT